MSSSPDPRPVHEQSAANEKSIQRNPHGNFKEVEASRPAFDTAAHFHWTQTKNPNWKPGDGASDGGASLTKQHVSIDPYEEGRPAIFNYKLLISAIVPRPIAFMSTRSADGASTNLAPYSFFQVIGHDPPLFIIGYANGSNPGKDSLQNLAATGECTINIISEHYLEAANAASVNAPYGTSEWALTGLHPAPSQTVKPDRVREAVFSVEARLLETKQYESRGTPGKKTTVLAIVEGVRFWVREDAVNEQRNLVDPDVLRPMSRLGGITYGRVLEGLEIPRPDWDEFKKTAEPAGLVKAKMEDQ